MAIFRCFLQSIIENTCDESIYVQIKLVMRLRIWCLSKQGSTLILLGPLGRNILNPQDKESTQDIDWMNKFDTEPRLQSHIYR